MVGGKGTSAASGKASIRYDVSVCEQEPVPARPREVRRRLLIGALIVAVTAALGGNIGLWLAYHSHRLAEQQDRLVEKQATQAALEQCRRLARDAAAREYVKGIETVVFTQTVTNMVDDWGRPTAWVRDKAKGGGRISATTARSSTTTVMRVAGSRP